MELVDINDIINEINYRKRINQGHVDYNNLYEDEAIEYIVRNLAVTEFDFDEEFKEYVKPDLQNEDIKEIAEHFFKIGLKLQNGKNDIEQRVKKCPFRIVACTAYEGQNLGCTGACGWVNDHVTLKSKKE
ncbi:MAG: hypothetical protein IKO36_03685 [Bacteroidaceae bacterium]|nr:hypothetical protein [Bacteroidaceae bacterium]